MRVLTVVGNRPQFIKSAAVTKAFEKQDVDELLVHTGQHYSPNMSDVFFAELGLPTPWRSLGVGSGTHAQQTAAMLTALELAIVEATPDLVLVYGDTNSTIAAALATSKCGVRLAHVEAGLRSFDRRMPEEVNRVVTDHLSDLLFAPTSTAVRNLLDEGRPEPSIHLVGDVMFDVAKDQSARARGRRPIVDLDHSRSLLVTIHRVENTDDPDRLRTIAAALIALAGDFDVVFPVHPRTLAALRSAGLESPLGERIRLVEPLGFLDMVALEQTASVILTDSGGVQREAYFHGVPSVVVRETSEWVELIEAGWSRLCPALDAASIVDAVRSAVGTTGRDVTLFGDGAAAEHIVDILLCEPTC